MRLFLLLPPRPILLVFNLHSSSDEGSAAAIKRGGKVGSGVSVNEAATEKEKEEEDLEKSGEVSALPPLFSRVREGGNKTLRSHDSSAGLSSPSSSSSPTLKRALKKGGEGNPDWAETGGGGKKRIF